MIENAIAYLSSLVGGEGLTFQASGTKGVLNTRTSSHFIEVSFDFAGNLPDFTVSQDSAKKLGGFLTGIKKTVKFEVSPEGVLSALVPGKKKIEIPTEEFLPMDLQATTERLRTINDSSSLSKKLNRLLQASSGKFTGGLYLSFSPKGLRAFSTDGYLLCWSDFPEVQIPDAKIILQEGFSPKLFSDKTKIAVEPDSIYLESAFSGFFLRARIARLKKNFLDADKVIALNNPDARLVFDYTEFSETIRSFLSFDENSTEQKLSFSYRPNELAFELSLLGVSGRVEEIFPVMPEKNNPLNEFALKFSYFKKIFRLFEEDFSLEVSNSNDYLHFFTSEVNALIVKEV